MEQRTGNVQVHSVNVLESTHLFLILAQMVMTHVGIDFVAV